MSMKLANNYLTSLIFIFLDNFLLDLEFLLYLTEKQVGCYPSLTYT